MKKNTGLVPLRNFAQISNNLFRSAQPEYSYEYAWLKKVAGIDIIVNLRSESDHDSNYAPGHGIKVRNYKVKDHCVPTLMQANSFIKLIRGNAGKNILFHCEHGHGRTSTFCVLARIADGWSLEAALKEEKNKFHYEFQHHAQEAFLRKHFSNFKG